MKRTLRRPTTDEPVPRAGSDVLEVTGYRPDSLLEVNTRIDVGEVSYRYQLTPVNPAQTLGTE